MPGVTKCNINEDGRECGKCGEFKIWEMFYKNKIKKFGYSSTCIRCCSEIKSKGTFEREAIENKILGQRHSSKKYEKPVDKMTTNHQYAEDKPYWDTSDMIELGTAPHPYIFNKIK